MVDLARRGISPAVVDDQYGRLTFADDLAHAIAHLLTSKAEFGTYNVTNEGPTQSWFDIATEIFALAGAEGAVSRTSTEAYGRGKTLAPRPKNSNLNLCKLRSTGFIVPDASERLRDYVARLTAEA